MNINGLRALETKYLQNDGKLDAAEAKDLLAKAKESKDPSQLAAVREMFARDAFEGSVKPNSLLKTAGAEKVTTSSIAGQKVGTGAKGEAVKVVRTFGDAEGYSNKFQALSIARLQGSGNVAVVQDPKTKKWHAAQTDVPATKLNGEGFAPKPYDQAAFEKAKKNAGDPPTEAQARELASIIYGVPQEMINVVSKPVDELNKHQELLDPNKININLQDTANGHLHSENCGCGKNPALVVTPSVLKQGYAAASSTLFHEGTHYSDAQLVSSAIAKYGKPVGTPKEQSSFQKWLYENSPYGTQKNPMFSKADVATILNTNQKQGQKDISEGRASVGAFRATFEKDPERAEYQLKGLAQYALTHDLDGDVKKQIFADLKAMLSTLPEDQRERFRDALKAADKNATTRGGVQKLGLEKGVFG